MNEALLRLRTRVLDSLAPPVPTRLAEGRLERAWQTLVPHAPLLLLVAALLGVWAAYAHLMFFLCDDAFISFRYARNLWEGHGLVFNRGERVEGYTNFLWVLELAALKLALGLEPKHSSIALSIAYTLGVFWVTAKLAGTSPFMRERKLAVLLAIGLLVVNRNVAVWTSSGLETRQFTFFALLAVWLLQRERPGLARYVPASLAFALCELTRPEASLLFACGAAWLLLRASFERRLRTNELLGFLLPYLIVVGAHTAFRYFYYGEIVPNTYYAKNVRPWPEGGSHYLLSAVLENGLYLAWPLALLGACARLTLRRDWLHVLSVLMLWLHMVYLVRIGGDHFEYRPFDLHWPLLALACADGLLAIRAGAERAARRLLPDHAQVSGHVVLAAVASVLVAYCTVVQIAHAITTNDLETREETFGLHSKLDFEAFPAAFLLPGMSRILPAYNAALAFTSKHSIGLRWAEHRAFHRHQSAGYEPYRPYARDLIPKDAVMPKEVIGVIGDVLGTITLIDVLGLTDRTIARAPVSAPNRLRQLAHDRFPPPGYLEQRGVNLDVLPAASSFEASTDFALQLPGGVWMPLQSTKPDYVQRAFRGRGLWHKQLSTIFEHNRLLAQDRMLEPRVRLGFFDDGTLEGWKRISGDGLASATLKLPKHQGAPTGYVGGGLIDSFTDQVHDRAVATLESPVFTPERGDVLVFLVGGGAGQGTRVELLSAGHVLASRRGHDSEVLSLEALTLDAHAGKPCRIRIVDSEVGPWGHVLADHFMLMRPAS